MGKLREILFGVSAGLLWIASVHVCLCSDLNDNVEEFHMVQDKSFSNVTIYDRKVTCGEHRPGLFPSQTWTCNDIRVDGMRMAYGYYPGLGADSKCTESGGFDELRQLCYKLMESIASNRQLWGAQVSNASCDYIEENRVMLNVNLGGYYWMEMKPGYGWIETLQCVAFPKDDTLSFP
ncbi:uncharacterized protein LOC111100845 [Crassostrea virginica]|uniref:Uncharacterized protein LOC111100845 n=1 Tax=Crassostrea virginica TaxID=6565 RepID=A0A8B8ADU9_CRAVI|nr:uncharacterized protein LOC111100845 [Crassostrea virginica]